MLEKLSKFIDYEGIDLSIDRFVLAVSGGVDSMVLLYLFLQLKAQFSVAHCNYQLRGKDSEMDQDLVQNYCESLGVDFEFKRFDTMDLAKKAKKGIQEMARDLRYEWFEDLTAMNKAQYIVTAHQKEDSVETMLFNFTRGTGLTGLRGIDPVRGKLLRPLLSVSKQEIIDFAKENKIPFREDQSNQSDQYSRNKIRNRVIPELKGINSSFVDTLYEKSKIFREGAKLINKTISLEIKKVVVSESNYEKVPVSYVKKSDYPRLLLWAWLEPFGFTSLMMKDVLSLLESSTGKRIESPQYVLFKDRDALVLKKMDSVNISKVYPDFNSLTEDSFWLVESRDMDKHSIVKDSKFANLDFDRIKFPLERRSWKEGDVFVPFGSQTEKKVSHFLTSEKVSSAFKKEVEVLTHGERIIWVIGFRIDQRFALHSESVKCLFIELNS